MGVRVREKPKGSGEWWVFIEHLGKRKAKKIGRDKKLAIDVAKKLEAKLTLNALELNTEKQETPVFRTVADQWLQGYIRTMRRPSTLERYTSILNKHVVPCLGSIPIDQVKRADVRDMILMKKQDCSSSVIRLIRDVTSGVMNHAIDDGIIENNPVRGITKRLQLEREKDEVTPFSVDEMNVFLEKVQHYSRDLYPLFLLAFRTGLRLGELIALEWGDIDFRGRFFEVRRSYKNGDYARPKNGKNRRVDLSDQCIRTLSALRKQSAAQVLLDGGRGRFGPYLQPEGEASCSE